jgi:hypothetical protein
MHFRNWPPITICGPRQRAKNGKGTHRAVDRVHHFARRYRYVLRMDIVKHFPSIDHAILRHTLAQVIPEDDLLWLVDKILESGDGVLKDEYTDPLDHFIKRDLRCAAYVRYVDDVVLFSDSKRELWHWKQAVVERLATLRLIVHPEAAVLPVTHGSPWLGFIVYPGHRHGRHFGWMTVVCQAITRFDGFTNVAVPD